MKLMYICLTPQVAGAERSLLTSIDNFPSDIRFNAVILVPGIGPLTAVIEDMGLSYDTYYCKKFSSPFSTFLGFKIFNPIKVSVNFFNVLRMGFTVIKKVKIFKPDIVHLNNFELNFYLPIFLRMFTKVKIVCHMRELQIKQRKLFGIFELLLGNYVDSIIVISLAVKNIFLSQKVLNKMHLLYNAVDSNFLIIKVSAKKTREDLLINEGDFLIVSAGRITEWKGYDVLLKAVEKTGIANLAVCIAGDASLGESGYLNKLKILSKQLGLESKVKFVGFVRDIGSLLNACDLLVHSPVKDEPLGRTILEAMSLGKPVVASRNGGIVEIIEEKKNGFLFSPGNAEELSKLIGLFYYDCRLRKSIGEHAKETIEQRFSSAQHSLQLLTIYNQVLRGL